MRLLQLCDNGEVTLTDDLAHELDVPPYAILSHTWGRPDQEVNFQDMADKKARRRARLKSGYWKIEFCRHQVKRDHLRYFWVDTCCIDKTNSAELSESINSMFTWYQNAQKCYVLLTDVAIGDSASIDEHGQPTWQPEFRASKWFTRGWTLQELIAPSTVEFFASNGSRLGDRTSLHHVIQQVTQLPLQALRHRPLSAFTTEERIAWSNGRRTTRPEDMAYALLGILEISMPAIYGEGQRKALNRLRITARHDNQLNCHSGSAHSFYIPFPENSTFTGRLEILAELQERLFARHSYQRLAILGLGGVGKTQIALQMAYWARRHKPDYSVVWLPAASLESFAQACTEIAGRLGIEKRKPEDDMRMLLRNHYESAERQWFLVVDNADDPDIMYGRSGSSERGVFHYLPTSGYCTILVTTRSPDIALSVAGTDVVQVAEMRLEEARSYFNKITLHKSIVGESDKIDELLKEMAFLPLAIAQAAAYLNRNRLSVDRYLQLIRGMDDEMLALISAEFYDITRMPGSQKTIATTWLASFERIRQDDDSAANMLMFLALVEPRAVPRALLPKTRTEVDTDRAIGTLCGYAFLVHRGNDVYDMHRLVHVAAKVWTRKNGSVQATEHALAHMVKGFPVVSFETRELWRSFFPHALRLLGESGDCDSFDRCRLFDLVATCFIRERQWKDAVIYFEQAYNWWLRNGSSEEEDGRIQSEYALACACLEDRQTQRAFAMLEHVVAVRRRTLDDRNRTRLKSEFALAAAYLENGQVEHASALMEHVVDIRRQILDQRDNDRLASEYVLARTYLERQQLEQGRLLLEHVVDIRRRTLDIENPLRLASEYLLARVYVEAKQHTQALAILEPVVQIGRRTLRAEDRARLRWDHYLATVYLLRRRYQEALSILENLVGVQSRHFKDEDPQRLESEYTLAKAYIESGRPMQQALPLLEHVVDVQRRTLSVQDRSGLSSKYLLAYAYAQERQYENAIVVLEPMVPITAAVLDTEDDLRLWTQDLLRLVKERAGKDLTDDGHTDGIAALSIST